MIHTEPHMSSSEEEEEFLVNVEFNGMLEKDILDRSPVFLKMIDVEGKNPVMQIGNQVYTVKVYKDFSNVQSLKQRLILIVTLRCS